MTEPLFFHVDLDAFYAAVETLDHPEYADKVLVIGGKSARSVVAAASYAARSYGIHSAMPMGRALRLCPHLLAIPPRMGRYSEKSRHVMEILRRFSPSVQQISIDEAFLDMTGTGRLFGLPREAGFLLKNTVKEETGLTISVGIGANRFIAKMASDYDKPDGLCRVSPSKQIAFVDAVGLKKLWGVGKVTQGEIARAGIRSTEELRSWSKVRLQYRFGKATGHFLYLACRGEDPGIFRPESKSRSISTESTFNEDISSREVLHQILLSMSHEIMFRALDEKVMARTVAIKVRYPDFTTFTVQTTPTSPILSASQVYEHAKELLNQRWRDGQPIRLIGVGLHQLYDGQRPIQEELFADPHEKERTLEKVVLELQKQGKQVLKAANLKSDS
ncbi:MAG: DNA polymerase IV [Spirochaetales bacterium]|nr:DNA polymerase IV [Spirochaetales bacterium]